MFNIVKRNENEDYTDYFVRLFENKLIYNLNCEQIADLLNFENGNNYGASTYRKEYAAFNRGRQYINQEGNIHTKILSISDTHCPFHKSIETFTNYIGVDVLQLNGDILDCQAISKFSKTYRISPMEEMIGARQYLLDLILYIKPKKVLICYGNHDLRFQAYFSKNLDTDLLELMPKTSLELIFVDGFKHYNKRDCTKTDYKALKEVLNDVEIVYKDSWFNQIGDTIFCHPTAFKGEIMKTSDAAVKYFRNEGYNFKVLVMAHTHRTGDYAIGNTIIYEQGACCDTKKMHYSDGRLSNSHKEGFIFLCQDKDGNTLRDKTKLIRLN